MLNYWAFILGFHLNLLNTGFKMACMLSKSQSQSYTCVYLVNHVAWIGFVRLSILQYFFSAREVGKGKMTAVAAFTSTMQIRSDGRCYQEAAPHAAHVCLFWISIALPASCYFLVLLVSKLAALEECTWGNKTKWTNNLIKKNKGYEPREIYKPF